MITITGTENTLQLRNPEFGDKHKVDYQTIINDGISGSKYLYHSSDYPTVDTKSFDCKIYTDIDSVRETLEELQGQEVTIYFSHVSRTYKGILTAFSLEQGKVVRNSEATCRTLGSLHVDFIGILESTDDSSSSTDDSSSSTDDSSSSTDDSSSSTENEFYPFGDLLGTGDVLFEMLIFDKLQ